MEPDCPRGDTHTTMKIRSSDRREPDGKEATEEFKAFIDSRLQDSGPRFELLSFDSSMTELHGQWAINYQALFLDKTPSVSETPLHMTIKGVVFLHPLRDRRVIDAFYSERGTEGELDGKLDPVGEELINGTIPDGW